MADVGDFFVKLLLVALMAALTRAACRDYQDCSACLIGDDAPSSSVENRYCAWSFAQCVEVAPSLRPPYGAWTTCPACQNMTSSSELPALAGLYIGTLLVAIAAFIFSIVIAVLYVTCRLTFMQATTRNFVLNCVAEFWTLGCITRNTVVLYHYSNNARSTLAIPVCSRNLNATVLSSIGPSETCRMWVWSLPNGMMIMSFIVYTFVVFYSLHLRYHVDRDHVRVSGICFDVNRSNSSKRPNSKKAISLLKFCLKLSSLGATPAVALQTWVNLNERCGYSDYSFQDTMFVWIFGFASFLGIPGFAIAASVFAPFYRKLRHGSFACVCRGCAGCSCCADFKNGALLGVVICVVTGFVLWAVRFVQQCKTMSFSVPAFQLTTTTGFPAFVAISITLIFNITVFLLSSGQTERDAAQESSAPRNPCEPTVGDVQRATEAVQMTVRERRQNTQ